MVGDLSVALVVDDEVIVTLREIAETEASIGIGLDLAHRDVAAQESPANESRRRKLFFCPGCQSTSVLVRTPQADFESDDGLVVPIGDTTEQQARFSHANHTRVSNAFGILLRQVIDHCRPAVSLDQDDV